VKKFFLVAAALAVASSTVLAEPATKAPLTTGQALELLTALRALDQPHDVVVKTGNGSAIARVPWEFGNARLRLRIKRNIQELEPIWKAVEQARTDTVQELQKNLKPNDDGKVPTRVEDSPAAMASFQKQINDLLVKPVDGPPNLSRISASDLKLDVNEIPLAGLDPIFDDNVSK
jgi:hypothetical protein